MEDGENYMLRSAIFCTRNILFGQNSENEMGKVCSTHRKILYLYNCYVM